MNKHLKLFANHSAYSQAESNLDKPNVAVCQQEGDVHYNPIDLNGHAYVDLGLPSGTLWATMNVGATSPTEYGNYYMYGKGATQYNSSDTAYEGTEDPLDLSVDTARQVWGGSWHTPTKVQCEELIANTTQRRNQTVDGVYGTIFTAKDGSNNTLFIPYAGYHHSIDMMHVGEWADISTSTSIDDDEMYTLHTEKFSNSVHVAHMWKVLGYSIRPVIG